MIEQLFGSKTRVKLLHLFYENPNRSFYVREITRKIDEQINSVRRELANLLSIGIITSDNSNNKLYYEVSQAFEYYDPLSNMFGGKKVNTKKAKIKSSKTVKKDGNELDSENQAQETSYLVDENIEPEESDSPIVEAIRGAGNIRLVAITGQFTLDERPGVDIVIVGDMNETNLSNAIAELESQEKKALRYVVFEPDEFTYRRQVNDRFISDLVVSKKVVLIDKDNLLQR